MERGVELNNPKQNIAYLPLAVYDDVCLEQVFIEGHIDFDGVLFDAGQPPYVVTAKVVYSIQDSDGDVSVLFRAAEVLGYDEVKLKFKVIFRHSMERRLVPRIYICFDHEPHQNWCDRFTQAWNRRVISSCLLRKQFYLDAMPTDHLSSLSHEQKKRVETLVKQSRKLEFCETTGLLMEVSKEYAVTMNSILFETHMEKQP